MRLICPNAQQAYPVEHENHRFHQVHFLVGIKYRVPGICPHSCGHRNCPHCRNHENAGSPYKTVRVNNFNRLHVIASGSTWRKIRCLQSNKGGYFQTCIALQGLPKRSVDRKSVEQAFADPILPDHLHGS